jgi:hypothetical protein
MAHVIWKGLFIVADGRRRLKRERSIRDPAKKHIGAFESGRHACQLRRL